MNADTAHDATYVPSGLGYTIPQPVTSLGEIDRMQAGDEAISREDDAKEADAKEKVEVSPSGINLARNIAERLSQALRATFTAGTPAPAATIPSTPAAATLAADAFVTIGAPATCTGVTTTAADISNEKEYVSVLMSDREVYRKKMALLKNWEYIVSKDRESLERGATAVRGAVGGAVAGGAAGGAAGGRVVGSNRNGNQKGGIGTTKHNAKHNNNNRKGNGTKTYYELYVANLPLTLLSAHGKFDIVSESDVMGLFPQASKCYLYRNKYNDTLKGDCLVSFPTALSCLRAKLDVDKRVWEGKELSVVFSDRTVIDESIAIDQRGEKRYREEEETEEEKRIAEKAVEGMDDFFSSLM